MTKIIVKYTERPWWAFGLFGRDRTIELEPPARATHADINSMAGKFRKTGVDVRIEW